MAWKGHPRTSTAAWKRLRRQILERDGYRCQLRDRPCIDTSSQVDHIVRGSDHPSNLRAVCKPCHMRRTGQQGATAMHAKRGSRKRPPEQHPGLI